MNLVTGDWIPIIDKTGKHRLVSLNTLYAEADQFKDLAVTPPQRIAVMRLLICITQAALDGPEHEKEWKTCKTEIKPVSLGYLKKHIYEFSLDGDRPFLQINSLAPTGNAVLDKLDFGLSAGNNSILFDHRAGPDGRIQSPGWCALMLLTYQAFSPGGTIGESAWSGVKTGRNSEHAPCIEGSALHTLIRGENLLAGIHLNLLTKKCVQEYTPLSWGTPTWEFEPKAPSHEGLNAIKQSYLGRLTPLSRGILLDTTTTRMTLVNGLAYPKLPESRDTTTTLRLRKSKKEESYFYLPTDPTKHPWRELGALLTLTDKDRPGGALALRHLDPARPDTVDIWTGGLAADKGKIIDTAEWTFSIPQCMLESSALKRYESGVQLSEKAVWSLGNGVKAYCDALKMENTLNDKAKGYFWSTLDRQYPVLLQVANSSDTTLIETWYPIVRQAMQQAYDHACPHETPRQIQAFALGQQSPRLKKPEP